jgi:hypothetical protein
MLVWSSCVYTDLNCAFSISALSFISLCRYPWLSLNEDRYLKELALELTPAITFLFHTSLEQGKLPNDWLQAYIVPVFKKGDKNTASNYRPVSLTSILCTTLVDPLQCVAANAIVV